MGSRTLDCNRSGAAVHAVWQIMLGQLMDPFAANCRLGTFQAAVWVLIWSPFPTLEAAYQIKILQHKIALGFAGLQSTASKK
jgi:hypothetical protein